MIRSRRMILFLVIFVLVTVALYRACSLSDESIRATTWKYNGDYLSGAFPHSDFLHLEGGTLALRNDTIYRADTVLAVVCWAYHKPFAYDRLVIEIVASGRRVEYVAK